VPKNIWFQHDINCHQKEKLSLLISRGGFEAYGRFWGFVELWYSMQLHKDGYVDIMRINESVLLKQLQMNRRSLPKLLQMFHECLGIVFRNISETYPIVYETTWDKSLNFITKRIPKKVHSEAEAEADKEKEEREKEKPREPRKPKPKEHPMFAEFWEAYPYKHNKADARKKFNEINPDEVIFDQIIFGLKQHKESHDWIKDNGKWIPAPLKWLRNEEWNNPPSNKGGNSSGRRKYDFEQGTESKYDNL